MASKVCTETGKWGHHPESNRTWTNFTNCKANTTHHRTVRVAETGRAARSPADFMANLVSFQAAMTHFYLVMIGHGLSLVSLLVSLGIFFHFK